MIRRDGARPRWMIACVVGAIAFPAFMLGMGYPWQLALLSATAIAAFAYSLESTWSRLRRLHDRPRLRFESVSSEASEARSDASTKES